MCVCVCEQKVRGHSRPIGQEAVHGNPAPVVGFHGNGNQVFVPHEIRTDTKHVLINGTSKITYKIRRVLVD